MFHSTFNHINNRRPCWVLKIFDTLQCICLNLVIKDLFFSTIKPFQASLSCLEKVEVTYSLYIRSPVLMLAQYLAVTANHSGITDNKQYQLQAMTSANLLRKQQMHRRNDVLTIFSLDMKTTMFR